MFQAVKRWMYRDNRPHLLARMLNRFWEFVHSSGIVPNWVTLQVIGRKSGRMTSLPVVVASIGGKRYLVSMLGDQAQWVLNVRAAGGKAYIRSGQRMEVRLEEVPAAERPPILKEYLRRASGARPHIPVSKDAPLAEFEAVAGSFPVFRIVPVKTE